MNKLLCWLLGHEWREVWRMRPDGMFPAGTLKCRCCGKQVPDLDITNEFG